jgi:hypothetical protein
MTHRTQGNTYVHQFIKGYIRRDTDVQSDEEMPWVTYERRGKELFTVSHAPPSIYLFCVFRNLEMSLRGFMQALLGKHN